MLWQRANGMSCCLQSKHYDWKLRAIKTTLYVAGGMKRAAPELSEDKVWPLACLCLAVHWQPPYRRLVWFRTCIFASEKTIQTEAVAAVQLSPWQS